jgi:hypothetical protein
MTISKFDDDQSTGPQMAPPSGGVFETGFDEAFPGPPPNTPLLSRFKRLLATLRETGITTDEAELRKMAFEYAHKEETSHG